jgi:hypothetical protein
VRALVQVSPTDLSDVNGGALSTSRGVCLTGHANIYDDDGDVC